MNPSNPDRENDAKQRGSRRDDDDARGRTAAPPIEREHETYEGIFEEDEKREHERE